MKRKMKVYYTLITDKLDLLIFNADCMDFRFFKLLPGYF